MHCNALQCTAIYCLADARVEISGLIDINSGDTQVLPATTRQQTTMQHTTMQHTLIRPQQHCSTLHHTCNEQTATRRMLWNESCTRLQRTIAHCNTLQHTATHCNTLQHTATHCNTLSTSLSIWQRTQRWGARTLQHCNTPQHTCPNCNALEHTAMHCVSTLQHSATHNTQDARVCELYRNVQQQHCNTLQQTTPRRASCIIPQHTATRLQHTATHCNTQHAGHRGARALATPRHTATTLQHTATHCNTLQHTTHRMLRRASCITTRDLAMPTSS